MKWLSSYNSDWSKMHNGEFYFKRNKFIFGLHSKKQSVHNIKRSFSDKPENLKRSYRIRIHFHPKFQKQIYYFEKWEKNVFAFIIKKDDHESIICTYTTKIRFPINDLKGKVTLPKRPKMQRFRYETTGIFHHRLSDIWA